MAKQITLVDSRIVFASALSNTLNGSSQGDWLVSIDVVFPSGDSSSERLLGASSAGSSANRVLYPRDASSLTVRDNAASGCNWGDFSSLITFDDTNNIKIRKTAGNTYPDLLINDNLITPNVQGGSWQAVPQFGNLGENFGTYSGLTVSGFSYVDNVDNANNVTFSFDGENATPPISETVSNATPSIEGTGTPIWSDTGGGPPSIDADVFEGDDINIYTGEGLTGTPEILIDGVPVSYTGTFLNLIVSTDIISKTDVFRGWDIDAPLILRVNHDSGGYDNEIIIRTRTGYNRTQLMYPATGTGTLGSLLSDMELQHNDIVYYPTANNTEVNEQGYLMTDATSLNLFIGKYAEEGVTWYPYSLDTSAESAVLSIDQATISPSGSVTWTTNLVGIQRAWITDSLGNTFALTNVTDTSGKLPALSHGQHACMFGNGVTVTVSTVL